MDDMTVVLEKALHGINEDDFNMSDWTCCMAGKLFAAAVGRVPTQEEAMAATDPVYRELMTQVLEANGVDIPDESNWNSRGLEETPLPLAISRATMDTADTEEVSYQMAARMLVARTLARVDKNFITTTV